MGRDNIYFLFNLMLLTDLEHIDHNRIIDEFMVPPCLICSYVVR